MALSIKQTDRPWNVREAREFIQDQTNNFGIFFDIDRCYELQAILLRNMRKKTVEARRFLRNPRFSFDDKFGLVSALVILGANRLLFKGPKGDIAYTADIRESLLEDPTVNDDVKYLVKLSADYISDKRNSGNIRNFADDSIPTSWLSYNNRRMGIGRPEWAILNTSRLAARNPGIQGIPRVTPDIVTCPKGYHMLRCDSGQIEPRINVSAYWKDSLLVNLISAYNDAYFGFYHYCTMSDAERTMYRQDFSGFKKIEITDEVKDKRQVIKVLTNAGSYGSSNLGNIEPSLAKSYEKYIVNHPGRLAIDQKVSDQIRRGDYTFYGFFGTPVTPGETEKYKPGDKKWAGHVQRCGVNNPIQTTASELMLFSMQRAKEVLSRMQDSHICFYKHDEACFYISDRDMGTPEAKELEDITAYNVEGWIPIEAEPLWGVKKGAYPSYLVEGI